MSRSGEIVETPRRSSQMYHKRMWLGMVASLVQMILRPPKTSPQVAWCPCPQFLLNWPAVAAVVRDQAFLEQTLCAVVATRDAEVKAKRKLSAAMSAAKGIVDHLNALSCGTRPVSHTTVPI